MRSPKPRRRSYYGEYESRAAGSYGYATTTTTPTTIEIPAQIKGILDQVDGIVPDQVFGIPSEYVLLGAGIAITLLPLGKFKGIASLGAYAAIGLGGVKLVNPYLTAPASSGMGRLVHPYEEFYYGPVTGGDAYAQPGK